MKQRLVDQAAKKVYQELERLGEAGKKHAGDYYSPFWKEKLDLVFNYYRVGTYDRKMYGNAVIQKINSEVNAEKKAETQEKNTEINFGPEQVKRENYATVPEEIPDVSGKELYRLTDGQCGEKPKFKKFFYPKKDTLSSKKHPVETKAFDKKRKSDDTWPLFPEEKTNIPFSPKKFR